MVRWAALGLAGAALAAAACGSETTESRPASTATGGSGGVTSTGSTTGTTATGGPTGGSGGAGAAGGPVGGGCVDSGLGEPNETESTAHELAGAPIDDCDGSGAAVSGVVAGADDVDWFLYRGNDALWPVCVVDPTRGLEATEKALRICAFFQCSAGDVGFDECPEGTSEATSPENRPGCCGAEGFTVTGLDCSGSLDDDAYVFIRVDQPGASLGACSEYLLSYHY